MLMMGFQEMALHNGGHLDMPMIVLSATRPLSRSPRYHLDMMNIIAYTLNCIVAGR